MAVVSAGARLVYFDIPKVACTTLKTMFWQLDHPGAARSPLRRLTALLGRKPEPERIHHVEGYRTVRFRDVAPAPEGYTKVVLLRDPVARLKSAWTNKVNREVFDRREEVAALEAAGLPADPSFSEFVRNLDAYRRLSRAARVHTKPLSWHIGSDLRWYDRVFRIEEMDAFLAYVADRLDRPIDVPRRNEGGAEARPAALGPGDAERLRAILAPDYALLGGLYDFEAGLERLRAAG